MAYLFDQYSPAPNQGESPDDSECDAACLTDPVVVESQLQEEANPYDDGQHADPGQPVSTQDEFPVHLEASRGG